MRRCNPSNYFCRILRKSVPSCEILRQNKPHAVSPKNNAIHVAFMARREESSIACTPNGASRVKARVVGVSRNRYRVASCYIPTSRVPFSNQITRECADSSISKRKRQRRPNLEIFKPKPGILLAILTKACGGRNRQIAPNWEQSIQANFVKSDCHHENQPR